MRPHSMAAKPRIAPPPARAGAPAPGAARQAPEGKREVPQRDDDPAQEHAPVRSQDAIGHEAAEDRGDPDAARVGAVDGAGPGDVEPQPAGGHGRGHVQDEEGSHPVVAEPLPHLREEEGREAARVAEPAGGFGGDGRHAVSRRARSAVPAPARSARAESPPPAAPPSPPRRESRPVARRRAPGGNLGTGEADRPPPPGAPRS